MKTTTIYGVSTGDTIHYIGKTDSKINAKGTINKSDVQYVGRKTGVKNIFAGNNLTTIVPLKVVKQEEWYDEKLTEVLEKHKDKQPLQNAQWMLDGKRGFWEDTQGYWVGKKRDANTLKRLSESKYQKFVQYDKDGVLLKVWNSGKEAGLQVFKDYEVINGCGKTALYKIVTHTGINNRLSHDSYWFKAEELLNYFKGIPNKLNIEAIRREEIRKKYKAPLCKVCGETDKEKFYPRNKVKCKACMCKYHEEVLRGQNRHTVVRYNDDNTIRQVYDNLYHAAFELKLSSKSVQRLCRGKLSSPNYILKYGEKKIQTQSIRYPKYVIQTLPKIKKRKQYVRTKTSYSVEQFENGICIHSFKNIRSASEFLGIKPAVVGQICRGMQRKLKDMPDLRYGKKIREILS